jgi:hypothetical protein
MKRFSTEIYDFTEAFFESLKRLANDSDTKEQAIKAFTEYANCASENNDSQYDFMIEWLEANKDITSFRPATDAQIDAFGLDGSPWYIDTDNYTEAE